MTEAMPVFERHDDMPISEYVLVTIQSSPSRSQCNEVSGISSDLYALSLTFQQILASVVTMGGS